jgi:hypothetical protein
MESCNLHSCASCRIDEDYQHSRNASAPYLHCLLGEMSLVLFFLSREKVKSILVPAFWRLSCVGFATTLGLQLQYAFASLCCLSMLSCHSGRIAGSRLLSCALVLVGLYIAFAFVLALRSLISSGVTGSSPYNNLKGVKFVTLQTEVLWLHTVIGNSSAHFSVSWSSNIFFIAENISAFAFSTTPLD